VKDQLLERFLRYIAIDTQSNPDSKETPSNSNELILGQILTDELLEMGLKDAHMDEKGYVLATLPANVDKNIPVLGLIAHMDTSPDMRGDNIRAVIHENYNGKDIVLNKEEGIRMLVNDFPALKKYTGQTLITTDGTTLLGADNKAGIAEIMASIDYFTSNPDIPHGTVKIAFTPDEEIGRGADHFDVEKFGADFAFTIDGGEIGELQFENFNAAFARVQVKGRNIHPGEAKDKMINAILLGMEYNSLLPNRQRPEHTTDREGFFHLYRFTGSVDEAELEYIIRDHDNQRFEQRKSEMRRNNMMMNEKYGSGSFILTIKDQYYNMLNKISTRMEIIELAKQAMEDLSISPLIRPIRGGTDGARLSFMGLPCPNLFSGGHNFHGRFEFVPLESMEAATRVIINIINRLAASPGQ